MTFLATLISPHIFLFVTIILGFAIGNIRIKSISIGISGVLFVAIIMSYLTNRFTPATYTNNIYELQNTMSMFSTLGTSLFVSVIGLQTGISIKGKSKNLVIAFFVGVAMSISGIMIMLLISILDQSIKISSLLGILCGALTSTPGLSSVCELVGLDSELAVLGYGCAYLFGVVLAVFFAQLSSLHNVKNQSEKSNSHPLNSKIYPELILICFSSLLGTLIGKIRLPFINTSLNNTAGILLIGLFVGVLIGRSKITVSSQVLNAFKSLGLALFFAGTGFSTGTKMINFEIKSILYGIIISLITIVCGLFLCKKISKKYQLDSGFIIAGGMTSSPAYAALGKRADISSTNLFSFAYFGALLSLLIAIQIILH